MKVKVTKRFNDVTTKPKKIRKVGETLEVSEERAKHLVKEGMAVIVEEKKKTEQKG